MEWTKIESLLTAYYDGKTSLEEERLIQKALMRDDCPSHLQAEAVMFQFLQQEATIEAKELSYDLSKSSGLRSSFPLFFRASGIAAAIALFFALYLQSKVDENQVVAVINNEKIYNTELAKAEVEQALQLVSLKLNQGTSKLDYINSINTPKKIIK